MKNFFGMKDALIGPIALLFGGACFLAGAILRKFLNDWFDLRFSVIGCTGLGSIFYIIASNLISMKWSLLIGLIGFLIGGFVFSFIAGESSGGEGEYDTRGNYEE